MNKKNVDYILSSTDGIELLANLFQNGMALDLVDVTRARDNIDLPEDERHIYDMADAALDRVDLDKLYENAGDFELQDKYGIGVIDLWNDEEMNDVSEKEYEVYMADPVHPTQAGYLEWWPPKMEEYLYQFLER